MKGLKVLIDALPPHYDNSKPDRPLTAEEEEIVDRNYKEFLKGVKRRNTRKIRLEGFMAKDEVKKSEKK